MAIRSRSYAPGVSYSRDTNTGGTPQRYAPHHRQMWCWLCRRGIHPVRRGPPSGQPEPAGRAERFDRGGSQYGQTLVTVVMAGRPPTIGKEAALSDALFLQLPSGHDGRPGLADLLFGKSVPSGKLPVTFPKEVGQIPLYYSHNSTGRPFQGTETMLQDILRKLVRLLG